jgi:hypothetical protein
MLLAEDLLLLLTDDATGKLTVPASQVDVALGGAQLLDLSLAERVGIDERKRLAVHDGGPTGDPLLDQALAAVRRREGKRPRSVVTELGKKLRPELYARLAEIGILRQEQGKVLGIFQTEHWPTTSADHESAVRRALTATLVQGTTPEPRDAALVALVHALRATHKVVDPKQHGLRRRDLERRAKEVAEGSWGSEAVRQVLDEMTTAVMVAVTAGSTAAAAGAS